MLYRHTLLVEFRVPRQVQAVELVRVVAGPVLLSVSASGLKRELPSTTSPMSSSMPRWALCFAKDTNVARPSPRGRWFHRGEARGGHGLREIFEYRVSFCRPCPPPLSSTFHEFILHVTRTAWLFVRRHLTLSSYMSVMCSRRLVSCGGDLTRDVLCGRAKSQKVEINACSDCI